MLPGGLQILMVEDYAAYAAMVAQVLEKVGWDVAVVSRVSMALELLAERTFDAALVDLTVEDSEGLATFTRLHEKAPHLPVVVLTGSGDEGLALRAVQEGAQDFVTKGETPEAFLPRTLAFAIERMRSQQQLAEVSERLELQNAQLREELTLARQAQRALLPPVTSGVSGALELHHRFVPAESVGGDFFSVGSEAGGETGVLVCDVTGHGVRAALVSAVLKAFVDEHPPHLTDPAQTLAALNRKLRETFDCTEEGLFVTAFCLVANDRGELRFSSAGHPSPLRLDPGLPEVQRLARLHGPPLALLDEPVYRTERAKLNDGQRLLLFTDGLTEAQGAEGEAFGLPRLREAIKAHAHDEGDLWLDAVLAEARRFAGPDGFDDDVCLIAIDWREAQLKWPRMPWGDDEARLPWAVGG